jgi:hypothetical protein
MSVIITLDNLSKFNKRAHDQLIKLDPSLKLSGAAEIFARILGFNDVHHEQKEFLDKAVKENRQCTNHLINEGEEYLAELEKKELNRINQIESKDIFDREINDIVISKFDTDQLFKLITKHNLSIIIENDNLVKINIYNDIWLKIRFGKYKFAKTVYDTDYTETLIRRSTAKDEKINDIFNIMYKAREIDILLNVEHDIYNRGDFRYFVNKIKQLEKDKFYSINISSVKNVPITIDTNDYVYYTNTSINDLKIGKNRLYINKHEKIRSSNYGRSLFEGFKEEEEGNFDIKEKFKEGEWFAINFQAIFVPPSKYRTVQTDTSLAQFDFDETYSNQQYKGAYFDVIISSIDEFDPIDIDYDKWLQ